MRQRKISKFFLNSGKAQVIILLVAIFIAFMLTGGIVSTTKRPPIPPEQVATSSGVIQSSGSCCESGDGNACQPLRGAGETITYNDSEYGLLKRGVSFFEGPFHLGDSGETTPDGNSIILNTSNQFNELFHGLSGPAPVPQCLGGDAYVSPNVCSVVPDDELIFVCRENCSSAPSDPRCTMYDNYRLTCYGTSASSYDVYFRISDGQVPDFIRFCSGNNIAQPVPPQTIPQQVLTPPAGNLGGSNLHINTFGFGYITPPPPQTNTALHLSPWCKPAIYLYPESKLNITAQVSPQGKMTYTDPLYPPNGWFVTAYPDGKIEYQGKQYPYLYYEAEIPDTSYTKPSTGFVIERSKLDETLNNLLIKLGLNTSEKQEFIKYWKDVLPQSPYLFIGVIPSQTLDTLAPLLITPKPDAVIRITLYFEALEKKISVVEPNIQAPIRSGFTVVEWGGIFKRDPKYNFSCFM